MPANPMDPPAMRRLTELLDELVPDRGRGTPGAALNAAIVEALNEAEDLVIQGQSRIIMAALRGDVRLDDDGEPCLHGTRSLLAVSA